MGCDILRIPKLFELNFNKLESTPEDTCTVPRSCDSESTATGSEGTQITVTVFGSSHGVWTKLCSHVEDEAC